MNAGQQLRALREQLGLTIREVETASTRLAQKYKNDDYEIPLSRLSDIETKGVVPSIFRLYALAVIYRQSLIELLSWYGIDLGRTTADFSIIELTKSHLCSTASPVKIQLPVKMDPSFDLRKTSNIGRMVEQWGRVPLDYLQHFMGADFSYGYIGTEDYAMYPIILPGSFVQIDESRNRVVEGMWRSEYERPIYFVETREGYTCCWCAVRAGQLVLQPHPLSPVQPRIVKDQQEAEVIGQVIGVAMRLGELAPALPAKAQRGPRELN
ncbi:MAG: helix-turn-helix domain-containing protein [Terriglobales bacterium]